MTKHKAKKMRAALRKAGYVPRKTTQGTTIWKYPHRAKSGDLSSAYHNLTIQEFKKNDHRNP